MDTILDCALPDDDWFDQHAVFWRLRREAGRWVIVPRDGSMPTAVLPHGTPLGRLVGSDRDDRLGDLWLKHKDRRQRSLTA